jgi:glycosyltransferase involved in cell wall biosynthesis
MYPFARFVIVGDGPLRQSLEDLAARLEISWAVSFLGWIGNDQNQLSEVLRGLDAVVNPSLRAWSETFCIANIEAMAMAVPLVTFAVGGGLVQFVSYVLVTSDFIDRSGRVRARPLFDTRKHIPVHSLHGRSQRGCGQYRHPTGYRAGSSLSRQKPRDATADWTGRATNHPTALQCGAANATV